VQSFKEHAQDGRGIKRPPEGLRSVSSLMVARIRALCAFKEHAQDRLGVKHAAQRIGGFSIVWRRASAPFALFKGCL